MAIAFKAKAVTTLASRAGSTVANLPAGMAVGDLTIAVFIATAAANLGGSALAITTPAGWTREEGGIGSSSTLSGRNTTTISYVFSRKYQAGDPASVTFTHSGTTTTHTTECGMFSYSGVDSIQRSDFDGFGPASITSMGVLCWNVDNDNSKHIVATAYGNASGNAGSVTTPPSGYTSRHADNIMLSDADVNAIADLGTKTATFSIGVVGGAIFSVIMKPLITGGKIKAYDGAAWADKPMKVWNGSAWVEKPVKFWNGSSWVLS